MKEYISPIAILLLILYGVTKVVPGLTPVFWFLAIIFLVAFLVIIVIARKTNENEHQPTPRA